MLKTFEFTFHFRGHRNKERYLQNACRVLQLRKQLRILESRKLNESGLPREIWRHVFNFVTDDDDVIALRAVCLELYHLADDKFPILQMINSRKLLSNPILQAWFLPKVNVLAAPKLITNDKTNLTFSFKFTCCCRAEEIKRYIYRTQPIQFSKICITLIIKVENRFYHFNSAGDRIGHFDLESD